MAVYKVEIDDGDGNMEWIEVDAEDENEAVDLSVKKLAIMKPEADSELMVVISLTKA